MIVYHLIAITLAILIDSIIGDPPSWPHPVKWMGSGISRMEKKWNRGKSRKLKGIIMVFMMITVTFFITFLLVWGFYHIHVIAGILLESILISTTIARKGLKDAALEVYVPLKMGNFKEARLKLSYIVGRDTETLGEEEMVRGTVETVAENISDGVTAPLFWALIGGAPLALVYRAINTCDSMVGYKNEKYGEFGWASAKLDDVVNWIPSRLTGFLILIAHQPAHMKVTKAWEILFRDSRKHPSPNSGWLEASVAALLGVQLGGINYYKGVISNRAKMGEPIIPLHKDHIIETNKILTRTTIVFLVVLWIGGGVIELTATWF
ncbi:adenosylcobinamide-phosphate synthase CbiB [Oceanobacillus caeni]|uniref:adenosylcobinamide-phosphate synthase CbiB n=1 Tax=Oceanobacillus caeni TaxID=405946 RepID=UPI001C22451C|nr:adenosylcobinamide-phosphate synthase CbiB [Oceanobacillus caeni]MBU8790497.1 adenosylcobinamide-phosphate synthase CbiB [Oceanobacillus caeni]